MLTEREQRLLEQIEQQLAEDPRFAERMRLQTSWLRRAMTRLGRGIMFAISLRRWSVEKCVIILVAIFVTAVIVTSHPAESGDTAPRPTIPIPGGEKSPLRIGK